MKNKSIFSIIILTGLLFVSLMGVAQVAINSDGAEPDGSAMLDITSNTKGLLIPRVTSAQKSAISSPGNGLLIFQTDGAKGIYYYDGSLGEWVFQGSSTSAWTVDDYGINYQAGNVGIQTTSDLNASLYVVGYPPTTNYMSIFENGRANISSYGIKIQTGSTIASTSTRFIGFFRSNGNITGAVTYDGSGNLVLSTISDKSFKTDIQGTKLSLNGLMKIQVRDFNWKESNQPSTGFVAQELFEAFPEAVIVPENKNEPWMVSPTSLIPLMVKSIQDQQKIIDTQAEKIKTLEERLNAVEKLLVK